VTVLYLRPVRFGLALAAVVCLTLIGASARHGETLVTQRRTPFGMMRVLEEKQPIRRNNNPILGGPNLYYDVTQFVPSTCTGAVVCKAGDPDYRVGHYGNLGYNTLTGPGYKTIDFSILKNISVNETSRFQFRTEFFNLANHPNFFLPNASPFLSNGTRDPQAGRITQTRGTARQIQFALKYLF